MAKNTKYIYFLEGECEEKIVETLKKNHIKSGIKKIINLTQKELKKSYLSTITPKTSVIIVFDTDVPGGINMLNKNISELKKCKNVESIILIPQVKNFEDELKRATTIKQIKEFTSSKSNKDFKKDFINLSNCESNLEKHKFDINRFWSTNPTGAYQIFKNESHKIKIKKK